MRVLPLFAYIRLFFQSHFKHYPVKQECPKEKIYHISEPENLIPINNVCKSNDAELSDRLYNVLLTAFESGNTLYANEKTRAHACKALEQIIHISLHSRDDRLKQRAAGYIRYCHKHKLDSMGQPISDYGYKRITQALRLQAMPPSPRRHSTTKPEISVAFNDGIRISRVHQDDLYNDMSPDQLFGIITNKEIGFQYQRKAFETLLYLFENRKDTNKSTAILTAKFIGAIAQRPHSTSLAWEALVYMTTCYNNRHDGAGNALDSYTLSSLRVMLRFIESRFKQNNPHHGL